MKQQLGFTLIELLVTTAITALALMGAYTMQNNLLKNSTEVSDMSQGVFVNSAILEAISANPAGIPTYDQALDVLNPERCTTPGINCGANDACIQALVDIRSLLCPLIGTGSNRRKQSSAAQVPNLLVSMGCSTPGCALTTCESGNTVGSCIKVTLVSSWDVYDRTTGAISRTVSTMTGTF